MAIGLISNGDTGLSARTEINSAIGVVNQLAITAAKVLTVTNTLTLTATDGSTLAIGTGGTLGTAAYTAASAYLPIGGGTLTGALVGTSLALNGATIGSDVLALVGTVTLTGTAVAQSTTGTSPGWYAQITGDSVPRCRVGVNANDTGSIGFGSGAATRDLFLERVGAANLRHGGADAAAPVAQTISVQNVITGTSNTAGGSFTIAGSQGTGTGAGGSIILQVAPAGTTGTSVNALATALTIDSAKNATFGASIIFGTNGSIAPQSTGVLTLLDNAGTAFNRLQFGGTTASFPSLQRSTTQIICRLADDSSNASFSALTLTTTSNTANTSGIVSGSSVQSANSSTFGFRWGSTGSRLYTGGTDGVIVLGNAAATGFTQLMFGGSTASFPSLKRTTTTLAARLADDSADSPFTAAAGTFSGLLTGSAGVTVASGQALKLGNAATTGLAAGVLAATTNATVVVTDSAGQVYRVPCII